jgi:hypothetical protein
MKEVSDKEFMEDLTDKKFLQWIFDRLENVHGENPSYDYMYRLKAIIKDYPKDKNTNWWI